MKTLAARSALVSFTLVAAMATGCNATSDDDVRPNVDVEMIGKSLGALSAASVTALNGTYGGACDGRTEGDPWSAGANGNTTLDNAALSVRKNDSDCVLTLTEIKVGGTAFDASADIALGTAYAGSPSSFKDVSEDPIDFYGNAKISATSFAADFTITLTVSANHNDAVSASKQGVFATQSSTVSVGNVAAPNYTVSMASFTMETDVGDVVTATGGHAALTAGSTAQHYAIHEGTLSVSSTPEDVASAYSGATFSGLLSGLTSLQIPDEQFDLVGEDLTAAPVVRTIILRNTDSDSGVVSYQLIAVSFSKP